MSLLDNDHTELLRRIVETAKEMKVEMCQAHGGPADNGPVILGSDSAGTPFLIPDTMEGHPTDNLGVILGLLSEKLSEKNDTMRWDWLAYIVEGYLNGSPAVDEVDTHERGNYARDYKENPASTVKEGLIVSMFTWNGDSDCTTLVYHYGDDGMPVWEEALGTDEAPQGLIPDIFRNFRTYCEHEGKALPRKNN